MIRSAAVGLTLLLPAVAIAGRQPFNETLDVEILPKRVAELQSSVTDRMGTPDGADDETAVWWAGAFGVAPTVQVLLASEIAFAHADATTQFTWYSADVRWQLRKPGPPPGPGQPVPLLRLLVERLVQDQMLEGRADLAIGTDLTEGVHSSVMLGATAVSTGEEAQLQAGVGIIGDASQSLRIGGEVFAELPLVPSGALALSAGPDASFTLGSFWITTGVLVGIGTRRSYDASVRIAWGVEF